MKKLNLLSKAEMKKVVGGVEDIGTPGGDNGNPCADGGCQNIGMLTAQYPGGIVKFGNCNEYEYDANCHNGCVTYSGSNIWC